MSSTPIERRSKTKWSRCVSLVSTRCRLVNLVNDAIRRTLVRTERKRHSVKVAEPTSEQPSGSEAEPLVNDKPSVDAALGVRMRDTYERIVQRVTHELGDVTALGKRQWDEALAAARNFVLGAKPDERERHEVESVAATVEKDARHGLHLIKVRGTDWARSASFLAARDKGAQVLLKLVLKIKDAAEAVESNLAGAMTYHRGEHVPGGHFLCASCSKEVVLDVSRRIPACPTCGKGEFRRKM